MKRKNRCPALSPGAGLQCELREGHDRHPFTPRHRIMNSFWSNDEGSLIANLAATQAASMDPTPIDPEEELRTWWFNKASSEIDATVPKAVEYGSTDLIDIGLMLARTMRREVTEEEAAELGVFFYLIGKIARWQSAIERGERPSDDTLLDIGIYVRMAQRIRDAGSWPGTENL